MKKRTGKKLTLNRETVKRLEKTALGEVAGGLSGGGSACVNVCIYPTNANISVCKKCHY